MYFFSDTSLKVTASTVVGYWNVAGYQQINVQAWVQGAPGSIYLTGSFNNLVGFNEKLTIATAGPGNFALLTRTYPIHAPNMSIVLYNPSTPMDVMIRLYAACCEARSGFIAWLLPAKQLREGDAERRLNEPVDLEALARTSGPVEAQS